MVGKKAGKGGEEKGFSGVGGLLGGLATLLEKLGDLAEKGEELKKSGEIRGADGKVHGVYGFNIKMGLGKEGVEVEPFGNVRKDAQTGRPVVHEIREPMVDVFDEKDHVLVVAEMPGVGQENITLELKQDILTITASKGDKKYRKEVLLPAAFSTGKMSHKCRNGVLEIKFTK